jgi:glucose-1-phosphate thymidylyltransferase
MDAIVLAGGYATRLWPICRHRPKMLLPLGERTVLDGILEELESEPRIDTVYLSTNERFAGAFGSFLDGRSFEKPTLSVEDSASDEGKLGTVDALAQLVDREGVDDDTVVIGGDNMVSFDLGAFLDAFQRRRAPTIAVHDVGADERARDHGVVELDGDRVVGFQQKPAEPESTLVSVNCYVGTGDTVELLREYYRASDDDGGGPDDPGWIISYLHRAVPTYGYTV